MRVVQLGYRSCLAFEELPRLGIVGYGLGQDRPHTLAEIARGLSLSRERVRQLERESLAVLRDAGIRADISAAA